MSGIDVENKSGEIIDRLIELVKNDCTVAYFSNALHNIHQEFDINANGSEGWNCMHLACQYGNSDVVRYLINSKKADVNTVSESGWTPLQIASH